jgi:hypothetical protein
VELQDEESDRGGQAEPVRRPRQHRSVAGFGGIGLAGLGLAAALAVGACTVNPAVGAVSRESAVATAIGSSGSTTPVTLISATLTTFGSVASGSSIASAETQVWAIALSGTFQPPSCGPSQPSTASRTPCPPATSELVVINAQSGAVIVMQAPAPSAA